MRYIALSRNKYGRLIVPPGAATMCSAGMAVDMEGLCQLRRLFYWPRWVRIVYSEGSPPAQGLGNWVYASNQRLGKSDGLNLLEPPDSPTT